LFCVFLLVFTNLYAQVGFGINKINKSSIADFKSELGKITFMIVIKNIYFQKILLIFSIFLGLQNAYAQVGLGTNSPNPSSIADFQADDKGILIPRVALKSTIDKTAIDNDKPIESLLLYNTATTTSGSNDVKKGFYYWDGNLATGKWERIHTEESLNIIEIKKDTVLKMNRLHHDNAIIKVVHDGTCDIQVPNDLGQGFHVTVLGNDNTFILPLDSDGADKTKIISKGKEHHTFGANPAFANELLFYTQGSDSIVNVLGSRNPDFIFDIGITQSTTIGKTVAFKLGSTANVKIDWGDGKQPVTYKNSGTDSRHAHEYATTGTYRVKVSGVFSQMIFDKTNSAAGKELKVLNWGTTRWKTTGTGTGATRAGMFQDIKNLKITAKDIPDFSELTSMKSMFQGVKLTGGIPGVSHWDVSKVTGSASCFNFRLGATGVPDPNFKKRSDGTIQCGPIK